jgi:DNA-binding MarR family transcriptional regulator
MKSQLFDVKQSPGGGGRDSAAPALGLLEGLIGYQLRLAQRAVFADFAESVGADGISPGLFGMLVVIEANPGLKQQRLAEAAHLDRSTVVSVIDKLELQGLVERVAMDRRSNGLHLTAEGAARLRSLKRKVLEHEKRALKHLSAAERSELVRLLSLILPERR